ncbi:MAG: UDP-N-acetylglucosamine--N-acetylmuramyl-(pentapeptide) pyrophosphoryl-undecaprenol N-acetylglucosamine transferase [Patescibacteria group bacterium]
MMKILLVGGGTSGHVLPALSVGRAILKKDPQSELIFVGSLNGMDRDQVVAAGFKFVGVPAGKLRRYWDWQNLADVFKIISGFFVALSIILRFWPDRVFIKGGYVGVPVGFAARLLGRSLIIHESDSHMGLANRILLPFAKVAGVAFPVDSYKLSRLYNKRLIHTGIPLNEIFYDSTIPNNIGLVLPDNRPMLLVLGGSQGAHTVNQIIKTALPQLLRDYTVVHLTGSHDFAELKAWAQNERFRNYFLFESLPNEQVAYLMKKSVLIISRSGATTIAEIAAIGKPVILVPLPGSASEHQLHNAEYLSKHGAAVMIEQDNLSEDVLQELIFKILNSDLGPRLVFNIKSMAQKEAGDQIADLILQ